VRFSRISSKAGLCPISVIEDKSGFVALIISIIFLLPSR
jgi:hypothetical protein